MTFNVFEGLMWNSRREERKDREKEKKVHQSPITTPLYAHTSVPCRGWCDTSNAVVEAIFDRQ